MSHHNHGAGGSYAIDTNAGRVLVERTKEAHEAEQATVEAANAQAGQAQLSESTEEQTPARSKKATA